MRQQLIAKIYIGSEFKKSYQRLPPNIQVQFTKKDQLFRLNAFDSILKTHQLKGVLKGYWAYSINYRYRVMFRFLGSDTVLYYDIGTHSIYQ